MKTIINSSKRTNHAWFNVGIVILTCLIFLIFPSCQKDKGILLNQESFNGSDIMFTEELLSTLSIYYGPETFTRKTGAPVVETQELETPNFDNFNSDFVLQIQNGSDKKTRVSSAEIKIDGVLVVGPSDFSMNISFITKQISGLTPKSILEVKLNSAPGSFIDLWIKGTLKVLPPTVTTDAASAITSTSATCGGNVTSDGGASVTARGVCWSTSLNPTTANDKTSDGTETGSFVSKLISLQPGTIYYVRAYANNSVGTAYGNEISFTTSSASTTVTDIDGNVYHTVTIGTQVWMVENLKTTKYNDGEAILLVTDNTAWEALTTPGTPGYYWYNNDAATYKATYGALYNWYTVNTGKLCPTGWHVPSDAEWHNLVLYLDASAVLNSYWYESFTAGGKLKETGTSHWSSPNTDATNSSGFTALPGGNRWDYGSSNDVGSYGNWWSSTEFSTTSAWSRYMIYNSSFVYSYYYDKRGGFSVRCLRDY